MCSSLSHICIIDAAHLCHPGKLQTSTLQKWSSKNSEGVQLSINTCSSRGKKKSDCRLPSSHSVWDRYCRTCRWWPGCTSSRCQHPLLHQGSGPAHFLSRNQHLHLFLEGLPPGCPSPPGGCWLLWEYFLMNHFPRNSRQGLPLENSS